MLSFSPSEEQQMIVNTVKQFANDVMRKKFRECDEEGHIPAEIINTAWELGLVVSCIPEEHGGAGWEHSALTGALLAEELAWATSPWPCILSPWLGVPIVGMGTQSRRKIPSGVCRGNSRRYGS
jgi:alkylation response protein AidB-like acyl-CoA dehydrogenase